MRKVFFGDLPAYQFHLLQKFSDQVEHAVFSREGGVSKPPFDSLNVRFGIGDREMAVKKNRSIICNSLQINPQNLISAEQTHSKNVQIVDQEFLNFHPGNEEQNNVDAFVTDLPNVALMIQVADCQAILMFDQVKKVAAVLHAGWKGLAQDISGATIKVLKNKYGVNPENLLVCISPSLGPCCAFFSNPEKELPSGFHKFIDRQKRVNLWEYSIEQLQKHGIQKKNIELAKICTQCGGSGKQGQNKFFSFRGGHGITGRFGVLIFLRS
jgi:YfiH family protein